MRQNRGMFSRGLFVWAAVVTLPLLGLCQNATWTGQVQCQLSIQSNGYAHQETQTWTLTGGAPTQQGAIEIYPATWTVTGQGAAQRSLGAQVMTARWNGNVPGMSAPIAIFIRASDNRLTIKTWHAQLTAFGATNAIRQVGTAQSSAPYTTSEWSFPAIDDVATSTSVSGSGTVPVTGNAMPVPSADRSGTATCKWEFTKGRPLAVPAVRVVTANSQGGVPVATPSSSSTVDASASPAVQAAPEGTSIPTVKVQPAASQAVMPGTRMAPNLFASVSQITPNYVKQGQQQVTVTVTGKASNFQQGITTADFGQGISVVAVTVMSPTSAKVVLDVDRTAPRGYRAITLTTGSEHASSLTPTLANLTTDAQQEFNVVLLQPEITGISPSVVAQGQQGVAIDLTAQDTFFEQGVTTANFGPGITVVSVTVHSDTSATAVINVDQSASTSGRNIALTTGSYIAMIPPPLDAVGPPLHFQVKQPQMYITGITPSVVAQGQQGVAIDLTAQDTSFQQGVTTANFGPGITVVSVTVHSDTSATAVINVDDAATPGVRNISINTGLRTAMIQPPLDAVGPPLHFQVKTPQMYITSISPSVVAQGQQGLAIDLTAQDTSFQQGVTTANFGPGITVVSVTVHSITSATAVINVDSTAPPNYHNVSVNTGLHTAMIPPPLDAVGPPLHFQVKVPQMYITAISPSAVAQGQQGVAIDLTAQDTSFQQGVTTANFGPGITVVSVNVHSDTSATAVIDVDSAAATGLRTNLSLTTGNYTAMIPPRVEGTQPVGLRVTTKIFTVPAAASTLKMSGTH